MNVECLVKDRVLVSYGEGLDVGIVEATIVELALPYVKVEFKSESKTCNGKSPSSPMKTKGPDSPIVAEFVPQLKTIEHCTFSMAWVKVEKILQKLPS